jgi:hypothetical protein
LGVKLDIQTVLWNWKVSESSATHLQDVKLLASNLYLQHLVPETNKKSPHSIVKALRKEK